MKLLVAGMARSGTKSMHQLFNKLGIDSYHERGIGIVANDGVPIYSLDSPPPQYVARIKSWAMSVKDDYFEANHTMSYMLRLAKHFSPDLEIAISLRDPTDYANSQQAHRWRVKNCQSLNDIAETWYLIGLFICRQIEYIGYSPYLIEFEKYIEGHYNNFFLDMYDINTEENHKIINNHLKQRINHKVDYSRNKLSSAVLTRCLEVNDRIKSLCRNI